VGCLVRHFDNSETDSSVNSVLRAGVGKNGGEAYGGLIVSK
jgi:hypothetical protein